MSNQHYEPSKPPKDVARWAVPATIAFAVVVLLLNFVPRPERHANWQISPAQVSGTRITVQGMSDASQAHPAEIFYRAEAHVTYTARGKQYTLWVPASTTTTDRNQLAFLLSGKSTDTADVKWNPADPTQAEATLHPR